LLSGGDGDSVDKVEENTMHFAVEPIRGTAEVLNNTEREIRGNLTTPKGEYN
jgi:hypothetical protein